MSMDELRVALSIGDGEGNRETQRVLAEKELQVRVVQANLGMVKWTRRLVLLTAVLSALSFGVSVLTFLKAEPVPEKPLVLLPIGQERGATDTTQERNDERLRAACDDGEADVLQLFGFGDPVPYGYVSCADVE